MSTSENEFQEAIRVERGNPTGAELATVIALLQAAHAEEELDGHGFERSLKSTWSRNIAQLRHPIVPGAGQWRGAYRSGLN